MNLQKIEYYLNFNKLIKEKVIKSNNQEYKAIVKQGNQKYTFVCIYIEQSKDQNENFQKLLQIKKVRNINIASILLLEQQDNHIFYTQEYFRYNLTDFLKGNKINNCEYLAHGILKGIIHLHNNKISHLNIKPNNILVDDKNNVKLCDLLYQGKIQSKTKQLYQPLEQINNNPSFMSDYFSTGAILCDIFGFSFEKNAQSIKEGRLPIINQERQFEIDLAISMMFISKIFRKNPTQVLELFQKKHNIKKQIQSKFYILILLFIILICFVGKDMLSLIQNNLTQNQDNNNIQKFLNNDSQQKELNIRDIDNNQNESNQNNSNNTQFQEKLEEDKQNECLKNKQNLKETLNQCDLLEKNETDNEQTQNVVNQFDEQISNKLSGTKQVIYNGNNIQFETSTKQNSENLELQSEVKSNQQLQNEKFSQKEQQQKQSTFFCEQTPLTILQEEYQQQNCPNIICYQSNYNNKYNNESQMIQEQFQNKEKNSFNIGTGKLIVQNPTNDDQTIQNLKYHYQEYYVLCQNQNNFEEIISCIRKLINQYIDNIFIEYQIYGFQDTIKECKQIQSNYAENIISCMIDIFIFEIREMKAKGIFYVIPPFTSKKQINIEILQECEEIIKESYERIKYFQSEYSECKKTEYTQSNSSKSSLQMNEISQLRINSLLCLKEVVLNKLENLCISKNIQLNINSSVFIFKQINNEIDVECSKIYRYINPLAAIDKCKSQSYFDILEFMIDEFYIEYQYLQAHLQQLFGCNKIDHFSKQLVCFIQKYSENIYKNYYPNYELKNENEILNNTFENSDFQQIDQDFPKIKDYCNKNVKNCNNNLKLYFLMHLFISNQIKNNESKNVEKLGNINILIQQFNQNLMSEYYFLNNKCQSEIDSYKKSQKTQKQFLQDNLKKLNICILENKTILLLYIKKYDKNSFHTHFNKSDKVKEQNRRVSEKEYLHHIYNQANGNQNKPNNQDQQNPQIPKKNKNKKKNQ